VDGDSTSQAFRLPGIPSTEGEHTFVYSLKNFVDGMASKIDQQQVNEK
jgi:hypothetical protein